MGKSSEKDGTANLLETPTKVESAGGKRNINLIMYKRKRWRSEKETKRSRNEVGNHLAKVSNRLGFPDDKTSYDGNKDGISILASEKGEIMGDSTICAPDSTSPGYKTWNMIPKVEVDIKPSDVSAPVTPFNVTKKHEKRMISPEKTELSEDVSQEPCLPDSSAMEIEQFTYECEGVKRTSRRSLSLDMRKFKIKIGKDLMLDETNGNYVDFCLPIDDKPASKESVLLSEDDRKMIEKVHDAKHFGCRQNLLVHTGRKQVKKQVEKKTMTRVQKKLICSSLSSDASKDFEDIGEPDEGKRKWCEKERELLQKSVKSFISSMRLIQGEMRFSPWKGSVMDSVGGAFLAQNVSDTLSSSAFMSLAAKYPHGTVRVNSPVEASKKKKKNAVSRKSMQMGEQVQLKKTCFRPQMISKGIKKGHDAIHLNILKECYSVYRSKKRTYRVSHSVDWDAVRMAKVDDISKAIQIRGMNNHMAERIKNFLDTLVKYSKSTDMEWIRDFPPQKAKEYLLSIYGLGLKSVECIRLLTLRQKAFPIDTNAGRVAVRLGWVPLDELLPEGQEFHLLKEYPTANSVQTYLWPHLSELDHSILYELHCQMITFGKVFCTKRDPNCNACPMKAECKYFGSVLASVQLPLLEANCKTPECIREAEHVKESQCVCLKCLQMVQVSGKDIEDFGRVDEEMLKENIHKFKNIPLQEGDMSKDLMVLTSKMASIPVPKSKNISRLRTEHQVYVLPKSHHVLAELEEREHDDSCQYLLAIWTPENLNRDECIPEEDAVHGTILIPARTAVRGRFPFNGTYFQANEVFADDESSNVPIKIPRASLLHLQRTTLYCGNNMSAICRGMDTFEVKKCFRKGFVCFRGFNRKTREPKSLPERFHHVEASKAEIPSGEKKKKQKNGC